MFIPDPNYFHHWSRIRILSIPDPRSRIRIKELKYFDQKKLFLNTRKYDLFCSFRIRIPEAQKHADPADTDPKHWLPKHVGIYPFNGNFS